MNENSYYKTLLISRLKLALTISYGQRHVFITKLEESMPNKKHDLYIVYPSNRRYWYSWRNWI